jgi:outer membrane protein assembly factor BamB
VTKQIEKHTKRIAVLIALTIALACAAPAAAQLTPGAPLPTGVPAPPSAPPVGVPGQEGPGRAKKKEEKDKKPEKFGPISVLPLQLYYATFLGGPAAFDPVADDAQFYLALKNKSLTAWVVKDGSVKWVVNDIAPVQPLALDSGRLYVTLDGEITAFDTGSGKPLWRVPTGAPVSAPPVAKAGWLILGLESGELRAVRGETGETVWQMKFGAPIKTAPAIVGDRLYVAPQNNHLTAVDLTSGQELWSEEFDGFVTGLAAQEHRVFCGTSRNFYALDHAGHFKWKRRIGAEVVGRPVTDKDNVYAVFTDNTMWALGVDGGDLRWRAALIFRPISGPVRMDDTLLVNGLTPLLHGYKAKDGTADGPDYTLPAGPGSILTSGPLVVRGANFFQDTVLLLLGNGYIAAVRRAGPGMITPFVDPGLVLPPITFGEPPPQPSSAAAKP